MLGAESEGFCDQCRGKAASSGRPDGPVCVLVDGCLRAGESTGLMGSEDGDELGARSETRSCLSWDLIAEEDWAGLKAAATLGVSDGADVVTEPSAGLLEEEERFAGQQPGD